MLGPSTALHGSTYATGAPTMDTFISMGTLAAFSRSVYALFWGGGGVPGHRAG